MSFCATPDKRRYATVEAAEREAGWLVFVADGRLMQPYRCRCGWWHLTRRGGTPLPAEQVG